MVLGDSGFGVLMFFGRVFEGEVSFWVGCLCSLVEFRGFCFIVVFRWDLGSVLGCFEEGREVLVSWVFSGEEFLKVLF